jgi:fused-like protein
MLLSLGLHIQQARRKNTGFSVAMKFINKHGKSEKDIKNLRQEIAILRTLNHENIILMFDAFETEREFCVVTEYAQGELFDILQDDQRLPERTVQQIAKQLVKALHYLHSNRIIHRLDILICIAIRLFIDFEFFIQQRYETTEHPHWV